MTQTENSIGEAIVGLLEDYGVNTVFGIPGVHNVEMYRALPRSNIRHILTRHEQGAGFMADGYARATGKPGICFIITGPGLTNIMTPMGQAYSDSVPMLVFASTLDVADAARGRGRLHEMQDQRGAAATVSARAAAINTVRDAQDLVAEAFSLCSSARPRPCYIEVPIDVMKTAAGDHGWVARSLPTAPAAPTNAIIEAARLLQEAKSPALLIGGGARNNANHIRQIAEATGAVTVTTIAGKGALSESHPLSAGASLPSPTTSAFLNKADVVLAVGTEMAETDLWDQAFNLTGKLIRIDIDPASLARPFPAHLPIQADAGSTLAALAAELGEHKGKSDGAEQVATMREAFISEDDDLRGKLRKVLGAIRNALPSDTVIATDMTQIAYAGNEVFPVDHPSCWLHPVGFGTLGYALPAAIGAKVGVGGRPVAAIAGDYGFQYTINELGTAAELRQPLPVLLWNNNALGQIRDDMVMKGIQPNAVTLENPDFQTLAKAYYCHARQPASLSDLEAEITAALKADRPTLIEMSPRLVTD